MDYSNMGEWGYLDLLVDIIGSGQKTEDRTGVGTRSVFGRQLRFDLTDSFPLLTTKRVHRKSLVHELLWFLSGDTNIKYLNDNGVTIWDEWADENGDLGPVYGKQWRSWPGKIWTKPFYYMDEQRGYKLDPTHTEVGEGELRVETIDQISKVIEGLKNNPHSRRHIVSAWNPAEVDDMALPPCHCLFQFYVRRMGRKQRIKAGGFYAREALIGLDKFDDDVVHEKLDQENFPSYYLDCQLYQRSADVFLGVPFNIASYSLLTYMIAHQLNMVPGEFIHTFGDVHIYNNHIDQVREQLTRKPRNPPKLVINRKPATIFGYRYEDFSFIGYNPDAAISAPIAV